MTKRPHLFGRRSPGRLPGLRAGVCLGVALFTSGQAQTFKTLYAFSNGLDGANPWSGLVLSHNTLYGTVFSGSTWNSGALIAVNTDGSGFTNLYSFTDGGDGGNAYGTPILSGSTLYGTGSTGGSYGSGAVFAVRTDGTGLITLHNFSGNTDGATPYAGVVLSGNILYGTTEAGGNSGKGTVFAVHTDSSGFVTLHHFTGGSDGSTPYAGLVLSGNMLYGTTSVGGSSGDGTVFALSTDGLVFTNLYSFTTTTGNVGVNSDGAVPWGTLVLSSNRLFGTASAGGSAGNGTIFALNTDGTGFTNLYNFSPASGPNLANSDGASPLGGLILAGNTLYGMAQIGGAENTGTVFALNTDGTGFTNLHSFAAISALNTPNPDGAYPKGSLLLSSNTLYGATYTGGGSGYGTVFSLSLAPSPSPQLTIVPSGANVLLTWSLDASGFTLQSATNLVTPVWSPVAPAPAIVNGQNVVTNRISGTQQFYRLSQ